MSCELSPARRERIRRRRQKAAQTRSLRQILLAAVIAVVIASGVASLTSALDTPALISALRPGDGSYRVAAAAATAGDLAPEDVEGDATDFAHNNAPFNTAVPVSELTNTHTFELINTDHAISTIPVQADLVPVAPLLPVAQDGILMRPDALAAVAGLLDSARAAGYGPFHIASGFRSLERQNQLYQQMADPSLVQPPGHSEHHSGLAADIVPTNLAQRHAPLSEQLDGTSAEEQFLADNAWRYGLILRYPAGTKDITGIAFEPWHFRYVGVPHAWYMAQHNLTLEEYLQQLAERGGFDLTIGARSYQVRYQAAENGVVYVPNNKTEAGSSNSNGRTPSDDAPGFSYSTDNRGGHIVTAWE